MKKHDEKDMIDGEETLVVIVAIMFSIPLILILVLIYAGHA